MALELSEAEMLEIMQAAKERMVEAMVETAKSAISWEVKRAISEAVMAEVKEFIQKEITPQLKADLLLNKEKILKVLNEQSRVVAVEIVKQITNTAIANLSTNYKRDAVLKALFD